MSPMSPLPLQARVVALVLFAVAFAYVEAAVVIYLRHIYEPIHAEMYPCQPRGELLPVVTLDELKRRGTEHERLLLVELGRELSTLVMLAAVAWGACRTRRQWMALFALMFGVWDLFFYAFLRLLIGWPESLWQWDVLFLLPVIWTGPVLAPVLVSVGLIAGGTWILVREGTGRPYRAPLPCWAGIVTGGLVIVVVFCWDWRNVSAGNQPHPFHWRFFLLGLFGGFASFVYGARYGHAQESRAE